MRKPVMVVTQAFMDVVVAIVAAYLLGSVNSAIVLCRLLGRADIRRLGSGNPGMSNVWRTMGARWAAVVLAADAGRGILVAFASQRLFSSCPEILAVCLALVAGNLLPLFHGFRGGKGFGVAFGIMLGLSPPAGLLCGIAWIAVARLLRMASLATLCAAASYPVVVLLMEGAGCEVAAGVALLAVTIFTHRQNIARLARGSEHRL